jgi:hypothetical protein
MIEIKVSQREYLKALRNAHPMDRFDTSKRVINMAGRLTAARLNNDPKFIQALADKQPMKAGNLWHAASNHIGKKMAGRLGSGIKVSSEETIKSGKGGSRLDLSVKVKNLALVDWKTTAASALKRRSIQQAEKHSKHMKESTQYGAKPSLHQASSWTEFLRLAKDAAAHLQNQFQSAKGRKVPPSAPKLQKPTTGNQNPKSSTATKNPQILTLPKKGGTSGAANPGDASYQSKIRSALQGKGIARHPGLAPGVKGTITTGPMRAFANMLSPPRTGR